MSSSPVLITHNEMPLNTDDITNLPSNEKILDKLQKNSKLNRKLTKVSHRIRPESALLTMIKLLIENRDQINVIDSVLSINSEDLDLVQKLNYCMEFLAHIPFSFQYNKQQTKILLEFFHLKEEMNLINNLEI